jgi:hypothetical protein
MVKYSMMHTNLVVVASGPQDEITVLLEKLVAESISQEPHRLKGGVRLAQREDARS